MGILCLFSFTTETTPVLSLCIQVSLRMLSVFPLLFYFILSLGAFCFTSYFPLTSVYSDFPPFFLCMCLCVECVPVCRPQLTVGIFLKYSPLYLIRQGELPGEPSPSPHTGVTGSRQACPPAAFSGGLWESRLKAS